jgi:DNA-binding NarL/FixJ family response regulator
MCAPACDDAGTMSGPQARHALRIVLADDSLLVREGTARLLEDAGFEVVGLASDADELMARVEEARPDVAIVDIRMPPGFTDEGLRAAAALRARWGDGIGILVLSQYVEAAFALRLLREGARGTGYLLKDRIEDLEDFSDAIRRVARGGSVVDPAVVARLVDKPQANGRLSELTEREREVLAAMAEGRSNQAIADRLFVTPKTVEAHIASIFSKLDLLPAPDDHRRVLAVLAYLGMEPQQA